MRNCAADLDVLPSPPNPGLPGFGTLDCRNRVNPTSAGEGLGVEGSEIEAPRLLHAPPPPQPSPSRLRACPLPANFSVTKPRQAGVWLGREQTESRGRSFASAWDR